MFSIKPPPVLPPPLEGPTSALPTAAVAPTSTPGNARCASTSGKGSLSANGRPAAALLHEGRRGGRGSFSLSARVDILSRVINAVDARAAHIGRPPLAKAVQGRASAAVPLPKPAEPEPKGSTYPRLCGQIWMIRRFTSAQFFPHERVERVRTQWVQAITACRSLHDFLSIATDFCAESVKSQVVRD